MSGKTNLLTGTLARIVLPEIRWQELDHAVYQQVFHKLEMVGELGSATVQYIRDHKVKIGFFEQAHSGAGWTLSHNITLAPGDEPVNPYTLSLICHEAHHLSQPFFLRVSVQGELGAWQHQQEAYSEIAGAPIGAPGQAYPGTQEHWDELSQLSPDSRQDLRAAQVVMCRISPTYRSHCLPLFPLHKEIGYQIKQGQIKEAFSAIWNLVACR